MHRVRGRRVECGRVCLVRVKTTMGTLGGNTARAGVVWCGGEVRAGGGDLVWCGVVVRCGPEGAIWCGVVWW